MDIPDGRPSHDQRLGIVSHCTDIPLDQERDVSCIEWNRDGTLLATSSMDQYVRVWSLSSKSLYMCIKEHTDTVGLIRWSPNGKLLLSVGLDCNTILWDIEKKKAVRKYPAPDGEYYQVAL
jgi:transducin (beta)-like 1